MIIFHNTHASIKKIFSDNEVDIDSPFILIKELNIILEKEERAKIISNYNKLENSLGGRGASNKTAKIIYNYLVEENSGTKDS